MTVYSKVLGAVVVVFFAISVLRRQIEISLPIEYVVVFSWFMWALVTSIAAPDIELALTKVLTLVQVVGVSIAICLLIVRQETSTPFWIGVTIAAFAASIFSLISPDAYVAADGRISGTVGNANLFSVVLIAGLSACLAYGLTVQSIPQRVLLLLLAVFFFYLIAETGSRKGMVGSILAILIIVGVVLQRLRRRSTLKFLLAGLVGLAMLAAAAAYLRSSTYVGRLDTALVAAQTGELTRADNSLRKRVDFILVALEQSSERPILGIGLDNYRTLQTGLFEDTGTYSHSNYTEILVSTGYPGLFLYCLIYLALIVRLWKFRAFAYKDDTVGPYALAVALACLFIVFDVAMVSYYEKVWWLLFAGVIAQLELLRRYSNVAPTQIGSRATMPGQTSTPMRLS